ncbi:MAG: hypothetical protein ACRERV_05255 [Methylococcales bacterium]
MERFKPASISQNWDRFHTLGYEMGGQNQPPEQQSSLTKEELRLLAQAREFATLEHTIFSRTLVDAQQKASNLEQSIRDLDASCRALLIQSLGDTPFQNAMTPRARTGFQLRRSTPRSGGTTRIRTQTPYRGIGSLSG